MDTRDYTPEGFQFNVDFDHSFRSQVRGLINLVRQPLHTQRYKQYIPETDKRWSPTWVFCDLGIPRSQTRQILHKLTHGQIQKIVILGCGTAWDFGQWFRLRPLEIIAVDLYRFDRAWQQVLYYAEQKRIKTSFIQADLADLSEIPDSWADVVISDAVFEHCKDLQSVLKGAKRILKPQGIIYASYGPLWFSTGGDHFCTRAGLQNAFNHIAMDQEEYQRFFLTHLDGNNEDPQSGGRYVPLDLFSKLSSDQYFELFGFANLHIEVLAIIVSKMSLQFKRIFPEKWAALGRKYPEISSEQFNIWAHYAYLRKAF
jgi:SAM-dependent methyltransferase